MAADVLEGAAHAWALAWHGGGRAPPHDPKGPVELRFDFASSTPIPFSRFSFFNFLREHLREAVASPLEVGFHAGQPGRDGFAVDFIVVDSDDRDIVRNAESCGGGGVESLDRASVVCAEDAAGLGQSANGFLEAFRRQKREGGTDGGDVLLELREASLVPVNVRAGADVGV